MHSCCIGIQNSCRHHAATACACDNYCENKNDNYANNNTNGFNRHNFTFQCFSLCRMNIFIYHFLQFNYDFIIIFVEENINTLV